jgi:hypothetical protein
LSYRLVLFEPEKQSPKAVNKKGFGEKILFDDLPADSKVFLLYYPSRRSRNADLECSLREFGNDAGKNLFVNIGSLDDPSFCLLAKKFGGFEELPVAIMTANPEFASNPVECKTVFVKLEGKVLNDANLAIGCLEKLFLLFIQGRFAEALRQPGKYEHKVLLSSLKSLVSNALKGMKEIKVNVELLGIKFGVEYGG